MSQVQKQPLQVTLRKLSPSSSRKDLWLTVREGSLADVDSALALLKKNGSNINSRNSMGLTPLHIATWRNHIPIIRRLLTAGADPDARDGESGWTSLHRALHFGYLAVASVLLQSGASISLEDSKFRTPVDLLSGPVAQVLGDGSNSATEVLSWGSGANYQLGTGNSDIQKLPCKVDTLHGSLIRLVSAAKFHSVAVGDHGEVYTWGFGRGGRLGHPDFDIHSGQAAVITPRQVTSGIGSRHVRAIAAAKHHTVLATEGGEVFTWGSNREGQLGYTVDTQPTPRRVSSIKSKIVAVAAANKHSAVVSDSGEVYTWGCNSDGQLGYGTSNSASNYTPRVVESLKGKLFTGVAAAKSHTVALRSDGEVYTWGHRLVTPRRVILSRNVKKSGGTPLKFHRMERLHAVSIAAGMVHSLALMDDGALFYWASADPDLKCQQLHTHCGRSIVSVSAGKHWGAVVTDTGDVYTWDSKLDKDKLPVPTRLHGVKRATSVVVGETHLLVVSSLYHPTISPKAAKINQRQKLQNKSDMEDLEEFLFDSTDSKDELYVEDNKNTGKRSVPSLKSLCEKSAADNLVETRNSIQMLEIADTLEANNLKKHCEDIVIHNLDYLLTVSSRAFTATALEILADLETLLDQRSSEPWSYRRLPTPTATFPVVVNSEEDANECDISRTRDNHNNKYVSWRQGTDCRQDSFFHPVDEADQEQLKQVRALRKKLQQIEMLEEKQLKGYQLDSQQTAKLQTKLAIESSLAELGVPVVTAKAKSSSSTSSETRGNNKKPKASRKQKRNSKVKQEEPELPSGFVGNKLEVDTVKQLMDADISPVCANKEEDESVQSKRCIDNHGHDGLLVKGFPELVVKSKSSSPPATKKKNRKGGLSMFLSGALDDSSNEEVAPPPPPPTPKNEGPAWGGAKISKCGRASLRLILDEQSKTTGGNPKNIITPVDEQPTSRGGDGKVSLSSFISSKPIAVAAVACTSHASVAEKGTPPWVSGTSPLLSRPSLRDIQMQQQGKHHQGVCHSPKTRTAGFTITTGQGSPSDTNKWFKPEVDAPSSIRSIQIEEKAMKDLKRFYSSVKIVRNAA
ncbi:Inhibitor of Bruton tyrosine kinase [Linum grandiflorum]